MILHFLRLLFQLMVNLIRSYVIVNHLNIFIHRHLNIFLGVARWLRNCYLSLNHKICVSPAKIAKSSLSWYIKIRSRDLISQKNSIQFVRHFSGKIAQLSALGQSPIFVLENSNIEIVHFNKNGDVDTYEFVLEEPLPRSLLFI